jgi:hypothetical protein
MRQATRCTAQRLGCDSVSVEGAVLALVDEHWGALMLG